MFIIKIWTSICWIRRWRPFTEIRSMNEIQKKPSTSELLDWLQALVLGGIDPDQITKQFPFIGTLLEKNQDIDTFESYKRGRGRFRLERLPCVRGENHVYRIFLPAEKTRSESFPQ